VYNTVSMRFRVARVCQRQRSLVVEEITIDLLPDRPAIMKFALSFIHTRSGARTKDRTRGNAAFDMRGAVVINTLN